MKTEYPNSPEMRKLFLRNSFEHELTIACGKNAFENLKVSLAHARTLIGSRTFDSVIYVNLPFSARRFTDARREVFPESEQIETFEVLHMQQGRLGPQFHYVKHQAKRAKGKVAVIINSWEMASSCYRYKEQLLFAIHDLVCIDGITVIVYSQAKQGSVETGVIHRSGLGRLPIFAAAVIEIPEEKTDEDVSGASVPLATPELAAKPLESGKMPTLTTRESVQLHGSKINELRYADLIKEKELEEMAVAA